MNLRGTRRTGWPEVSLVHIRYLAATCTEAFRVSLPAVIDVLTNERLMNKVRERQSETPIPFPTRSGIEPDDDQF